MPDELLAQTGCNSGERHPASRVESSSGAVWSAICNPKVAKLAPPARAGVAREGGGGGRVPYLDTPIETSGPKEFDGSTLDCIENRRNKRKNKQIVEVWNSLLMLGKEDEAKALMGCGKWFHRFNFPCGTYRLVPCTCGSPFCPDCSRRRSIPLRKKVLSILNQTKFDYWHLTVTVQSWLTLTRAGLTRLIKQFSDLRDRPLWKEWVSGGVYSIEATYSLERGAWHPHLHVLIETPKRLPFDWIHKLKAEWKEITGGSHVLNLEKMYGLDKKGHRKRKINMQAVRELIKYATKAASFAAIPERVGQFLSAFESVRRLQAFGSFLGKVEAEESGSGNVPRGPVGCRCGMCTWDVAELVSKIYHISDTFLPSDGIRQLRLFDSGSDPPPLSVLDWLPESDFVRLAAQKETERQVCFF